MSDSEFDPDQQQTGHRQQKEELYQCRYHPGPLVHHQSQKLEDQSSTDHMVDKQRLHAELNGHLHSQVNFNRCHQVSQATIDRDSHTASASPELKSTRPEAVNERPEFTDQANSARAKLLEEIPGATNLDAIRRAYMKASGSPNRVCRICNKKFSSGRALGGHMRVHGPLFIQGSATRNLGVFHLAANCTQKQEGACEDDQEETTSIIDTFEDESDKERAQQFARSEQASLSSGAYAEEKLSCKDSYGVADLSMCGQERGLASFTCNAEFAGDGEGIVGSATSTDKKSLLYELRRNPKRSRWFAEQDFTLEAQQAFMNNFSTANSVSAEGARVVCSECGKAFCSERALFGHMRCHPEREWRGVLPPESSLEQRADAIARYRRKRALEAMKAVENSEPKIIADVAREEDRDRTAELQVESAGNSSLMKEAAGMVIRELDNVDGQEAKVSQSKVGYKELHECISTGDISEVNIHAPRWRSNGRRSRRRVVNKAGIEETSSEEPALTSSESMHSLELALEPDQLKGLDCLMLLAEAARKVEEEATSQNCQSQLGMEEYAYGFSLEELKSGFEGHQADKIRSLFDSGECDDDAADYEDEGDPAWAKRERLHKDLVLSSIGGKYECTTCKKSFSTHQALGGHRASHKKTKGCFARTSPSDLSGSEHLLADELDVNYVQEKDPSHSTPKKKKKQHRTQQPVFKGHECSICHRIFLTGQALGGHKRCHWAGEKPCETASVASTEKMPSLQSDEQCSKMVEGGIDLNVPASGDEDDETGYGMAEMRLSIGVESACEPVAEMKDAGVWSELSETKGSSKWAWTVKDMLIGDTSSSLANAAMGIEARRRFDGIWGQHWPNNNGVSIAQLPLPVCAVQSLV